MGCSEGNWDGSFAFAIIIELLLFSLLFLTAFFVLSKVKRSLFSLVLFIAGPTLLALGILTLAIYGPCNGEYQGTDSSVSFTPIHRLAYAVSTGTRAVLLGVFLIALALVNKFLFKGTWMFGTDDSDDVEYAKPSARPPTNTTTSSAYHPSTEPTQYPGPPQHETILPGTPSPTMQPQPSAQYQAPPQQPAGMPMQTHAPPPPPPPQQPMQ